MSSKGQLLYTTINDEMVNKHVLKHGQWKSKYGLEWVGELGVGWGSWGVWAGRVGSVFVKKHPIGAFSPHVY